MSKRTNTDAKDMFSFQSKQERAENLAALKKLQDLMHLLDIKPDKPEEPVKPTRSVKDTTKQRKHPLLKEEKEIKDITDMIEKSGIKLSEINITNKEFDNLSSKEKLKYLKKNHELILPKINKNEKIKGFDLFKINSLLNPKNGGNKKKSKNNKTKSKK